MAETAEYKAYAVGVEVGQAGLEPATSASSVPRSPN